MATTLRWTVADLEGLPQPLDDKRYEIIDGELFVSTQPSYRHQKVCRNVLLALSTWDEAANLGDAVSAPGVIFSAEDAVAPDVVWTRQDRLAAVLGEDGKLHEAPDLTVEVLSPGAANRRRDRETKLSLYSRQGVHEYWIIDLDTRSVQVFRRVNATLQQAETLYEADVLQSPLLPGFQCSVQRIFAGTTDAG